MVYKAMVYERPEAVQKDASDSVKYENAVKPVKPFQTQYPEKDNAITVPNTNGSTTNTTPQNSPAKAPATTNTVITAPVQTQAPKQNTGFSYADYTPSDAVTQAQALLQQQMANKPGAYQSAWQGQLSDKISQILNREDFSYDLNADALYQQYADQYIQQGKMAMMDTMGQAQAMTGGYGNSYAQSVGQQAYQAHLQQLNDIVPALYGMALDQYNPEEQELYNQAALMAQQEDQEYGRYRDRLSDYYAELDRLKDDARYQEETDYGRWADDKNFSYENFINDRNYQYQQEQDALAESWRQKEFAESQRQHNEQMALTRDKWNWEQEQAANPTYTKLTHSDRQLMQQEISSAKTTNELAELVSLYLSMGYDPEVVNGMTETKAEQLMNPTVPDRSNRLYGAGRIGYAG